MDGWMDEWMDGLVDGSIDGWINGWTKESQKNICTILIIYGLISPFSTSSRTTSLACTSITTRAPSVVRVCLGNFPLTFSTIPSNCLVNDW